MRILINFILPFLTPLLVFVAWAWLTRAQAAGGMTERLQKGPWFWLILSGLLLVMVSMAVLAIGGRGAPGSRVIAPYMEDGRVVPPQIQKTD